MRFSKVGVEFTTKKSILKAYSYDASLISKNPIAVFWPKNVDEICGVVEFCYEEHIPLVARGGGTGLNGGAVTDGVVVDLGKMNKVSVDESKKIAFVESGVILKELNEKLSEYAFFFPVVPSSQNSATIGGMISTNASGIKAVKYGSMKENTKRVVFVDGTGKVRKARPDVICGHEGILGIVASAELKLVERVEDLSMTFREFDAESIEKMVDMAFEFKEQGASFVEFADDISAKFSGISDRYFIIAGFEDDTGEIKDKEKMQELMKKREGIYPSLAYNGHYIIEDPMLDAEGVKKLLVWLREKNIPVFGHIAMGILHPCFNTKTARFVDELYETVLQLDGLVSGEHGYGIKKAKYLPENLKARWRRLKKKYDPNGIMNPGKLVVDDLQEEIFSVKISEECVKCGLCNQCPVFLATRNEGFSSRARASLEIKDRDVFYTCTLCRLCEEICPVGVKVTDRIIRFRNILVKIGAVPEKSMEMVEKVRKHGNPFGVVKGKEVVDWHCC